MAYSTDAWQARLSDKRFKPIEEVATNLSTKPTSNIRAVEISFYFHEIYAGEKLLAKITYDNDDFVTQPWLVIINGIEIHRANTWAKCYNYITWHYKEETLPMQQQEVETGTVKSARVILPASIADSEQIDLENFDSLLFANWEQARIQEERCLIYFPLSKSINTQYSRRQGFDRSEGVKEGESEGTKARNPLYLHHLRNVLLSVSLSPSLLQSRIGAHKVNSCNDEVITVDKKGGSKWLRKLNWGFVIRQNQSICMSKMANLVVNLIYGISTISITIKRFLYNNEL